MTSKYFQLELPGNDTVLPQYLQGNTEEIQLSGLGLAFPPTPVLSDFACERLSVLENASMPEYDSYGTGQKKTTFLVTLLTNKMTEAIINSYFWASTFTGRHD